MTRAGRILACCGVLAAGLPGSAAAGRCDRWGYDLAERYPAQMLELVGEFTLEDGAEWSFRDGDGKDLTVRADGGDSPLFGLFKAEPRGAYFLLMSVSSAASINDGGADFEPLYFGTPVFRRIKDKFSLPEDSDTCLLIPNQKTLAEPDSPLGRDARADDDSAETPPERGLGNAFRALPGPATPRDGDDAPSLADAMKDRTLSEAAGDDAAPKTEGSIAGIFGPKPAPETPAPAPATRRDDAIRDGVDVAVIVATGTVPVDPGPAPADAAKPFAACLAGDNRRVDWAGAVPDAGFNAAVMLAPDLPATIPAFTVFPMTDDLLPLPADQKVVLPEGGPMLRVVTQGSLLQGTTIAGGTYRLVGLPDTRIETVVPAAPEVALSPPVARLLVVGAANDVNAAGLAALDPGLTAVYGASAYSIDWVEIGPAGQLAPIVPASDFAALAMTAQTRSGEFFVSDPADLDRMLGDLTRILTSATTPYDKVILVLEGQPWPHETPAQLARFIDRINDPNADPLAQIARRDRGDARSWLLVIGGATQVGYAASYLEGPVKTLRAGDVLIEDRKGADRTVLLTDVAAAEKLLRDAIDAAFRKAGVDPAPATVSAPSDSTLDTVFVDIDMVAQDIGILLDQALVPDLTESLRQTMALLSGAKTVAAIDPLSLLRLATLGTGALEVRPLLAADLDGQLKQLNAAPGTPGHQRVIDWLSGALADLDRAPDPSCSHVYLSMGHLLKAPK